MFMGIDLKKTDISKELEWLKGFNYATHTQNVISPLNLEIKNVVFHGVATIVFWADGTKTVVKARNEPFDPEKGLAMAISKKVFGNKGKYFNPIKKWAQKYKESENG